MMRQGRDAACMQGVASVAYSPLGILKGEQPSLQQPTVQAIAKETSRPAAQVPVLNP